jgi:hypothetical protein
MPNISRNLSETGTNLYINAFITGLYTNKSPLYVPVSSMGLQLLSRHDVLSDGLNMELSPQFSLVRRPGFPKYNTAQFSASDYPLGFYSFQNLSGTIKLLVDTPTKVYTFTTSALTSIFTKGTTNQTFFQRVGNTCYFCNGTDAQKYDGTTVTKWGIDSPVSAPTLSFLAGSLSPLTGYKYVNVYKNNSTGHISTASPASASTGPQTSKNITVGGPRSTDAQVDKVDIYRTKDGGSVYYYLTTINNPGAGSWSYTDSTVDSGLNDFLVAPLNHANDAPPTGISLATFHMGRFWVAVNNLVYFAGGPDTTNGVPEEAFPSANVFKFPGKITALASVTQGLLVFTSDNVYVIRGTDSRSFYSSVWFKNFGVRSQNCIAQDGDLLHIYTSKSQLFEISDSLDEIGFAIGDKLIAGFSPVNSYVALHRAGSDSGLFISNGTDSIYRYSIASKSWSLLSQPVGGVKALGSIETTVGTWSLLAGRAVVSDYILARDLTVFQDAGTSYSAYATIGSLVLAPLGKTARLELILIERMPVGTDATVSVSLNEISGSFTALPYPVAEPPKLVNSTTVIAKRHQLKQGTTPLPQQLRHLKIKVAFATEAFKNELLGIAIQ